MNIPSGRPELGLQRVLLSLGSQSPSPACPPPHPTLPTTARAPCLTIPTLPISLCFHHLPFPMELF